MRKILNKGLLFAVLVSSVLLMSGCIYSHNYDADGNEMSKEEVEETVKELEKELKDEIDKTPLNEEEIYVVNTIEETPKELIEECIENSEIVVTTKYYEMSDGTWRTDEGTYKYKLEITGRLSDAAAKDSAFLILSNIDNITFEQAARASGLSSYSGDYFDVEDAVIVGGY